MIGERQRYSCCMLESEETLKRERVREGEGGREKYRERKIERLI